MIEVETQTVDVEVVSSADVSSTGSVVVEPIELDELDITVAKREYVITGDNIYVPVLYDDAPQWMKDLVALAVEASMSTANASTLAQLTQLLSEFATSYVPLNQYTESILDLSTADASLHLVIGTLNSNYNDGISQANSQIIELQSTKASKTEVVTQVIDTLASQLSTPNSNLGAVIAQLNQAIANEAAARANSLTVLTSTLENIGDDVAASATAIDSLETSVSNINGTLTSQASQITSLRTDLNSGTGTWASGDSAVTNSLNSTISNGLATVESKWAYNSTININGTNYNSGFGLSNSAGTGAGSEFWIDASKLKFTNAAKTGSKAPFTIDASGSTPQVTFNGIVSFSNVSNVPEYVPKAGSAADINTNVTTINGSKITTGSISAAQIQAGSISADRLMAGTNGATVWSNGGLVSQNFNGNVYGNIGTPTQGFRLSSGAAGTSTDPNIYGGYIKGAILEGVALNITDIKVKAEGYPNNFGPVLLSKTTTVSQAFPFSGAPQYADTPYVIVYGRGYSSGYLANRACSGTTKLQVKGVCSGLLYYSNGTPGYTSISIAYRIGGTGSWYTLGSSSMDLAGKAVVVYDADFTVPHFSYVEFKATGGNMSFVVVELEVMFTNSDS